mmetsp:Transcript_21169/g.58873  ORF Transcript_21169/g.58873 Transcript_21169/m.58873 type:complete len:267 (+) Transcript_21169:1326-2126(+)
MVSRNSSKPLHSGHHESENMSMGFSSIKERMQDSRARSQDSLLPEDFHSSDSSSDASSSSSLSGLSTISCCFCRWLLVSLRGVSFVWVFLSVAWVSRRSRDLDGRAPASASIGTSWPRCWNLCVSSPPPMLLPPTKTLGTVRRPVRPWRVDWMRDVSECWDRSMTKIWSWDTPARASASRALRQYGHQGLEKTTTGWDPTMDWMQSGTVMSQRTVSSCDSDGLLSWLPVSLPVSLAWVPVARLAGSCLFLFLFLVLLSVRFADSEL